MPPVRPNRRICLRQNMHHCAAEWSNAGLCFKHQHFHPRGVARIHLVKRPNKFDASAARCART
eukprot:11170596-Lingulodinium_polyedra.AAC.1